MSRLFLLVIPLFLHRQLMMLPAAGEVIAKGHQRSDPDGKGMTQEEAVQPHVQHDAKQQT